MKKIWNVAIYARVSTDKKEQQESIPAQVQGLKNWINDKSIADQQAVYNLVDVYEDYGFSGTNFDRESFIKMREDIENGIINMVLTRDLSRFSRNYITAGYYLEDYFKVNGIRFVSVLDNVDTENEYDDIIPFKNILNEMYVKDCSRKVRDALKQRMIRGSSIASKPPYGYKFEECYEGNTKIIKLISANDETTETVRLIYSMYLEGYGFAKIATYLNKKEIAPPAARLGNFTKSKFGKWNSGTIRYILTNPKYCGKMVQQRWRKISYKVKKVVPTKQEEWIYGNDFLGIISNDMFSEVQQLINKRAKNYRYKGNAIHPFSTVIRCNECGGSFSYRKKYDGYKCTNSQMGEGRCTAHSVKEEFLRQIVIQDLRSYATKCIDKKVVDDIAKELCDNEDDYENKLKNIEKELNRLDIQFQKVYEDKLCEVINKRNADSLIKNIERKQQILIERKNDITKNSARINCKESLYKAYKEKIYNIINFQELDRMMVEALVHKIIIIENKTTKEKQVKIFYKFKQ